MTTVMTWLAAGITIAMLVTYELSLLWVQSRNPLTLARSAHANLREEWFTALSQKKGSEILAVQTLRNSLMSATMTASTAALGLIGSATLLAPSLNSAFGTPFHRPAGHGTGADGCALCIAGLLGDGGALLQLCGLHLVDAG